MTGLFSRHCNYLYHAEGHYQKYFAVNPKRLGGDGIECQEKSSISIKSLNTTEEGHRKEKWSLRYWTQLISQLVDSLRLQRRRMHKIFSYYRKVCLTEYVIVTDGWAVNLRIQNVCYDFKSVIKVRTLWIKNCVTHLAY